MSTVKAANLQNTGSGAPTFKNSSGTEIGQLAKAWVNFNGSGTVAIRDDFNVTSITDNGTGSYTVNMTNAQADTNYAVVASAQRVSGVSEAITSIGSTINASNFQFNVLRSDTNVQLDSAMVSAVLFGA